MYSKVEKSKFVGVVSDLDADSHPFRPAYYTSRIYIDLSSEENYSNNFEQLLRWIFDKPLHVKPPLGKKPAFLADNAVLSGTAIHARRLVDSFRANSPNSIGGLSDYLSIVSEGIENYRLPTNSNDDSDDNVIKSIEEFLPLRSEILEVINLSLRYWRDEYNIAYVKFFESIIHYMFRPSTVTRWTASDYDNFRIIIHELYIYFVALFIKNDRLENLAVFLSENYYVGGVDGVSRMGITDFSIFNQSVSSLEHRNKRLELRRISLHADLLSSRSAVSGLRFDDFMQADFILFVRSSCSAGEIRRSKWFPETIIYKSMDDGPFEVFARSTSKRYFDRLRNVLGIGGKENLEELEKRYKDGIGSGWAFERASIHLMVGLDKIGILP